MLDIRTYEGLYELLDRGAPAPTLPTLEECLAWSAPRRRAFDAERIEYINGGIVVMTSQINEVQLIVREIMLGNRGRTSGVQSIMLSGRSASGKTTACKAVMRSVYRSKQADEAPTVGGLYPIVYIEVPTECTPKALCQQIGRFFGLEFADRTTTQVMMRRVVNMLQRGGTELLIIDELHNLNPRSAGRSDSVNTIKQLVNETGVTLLMSGIDLHESPVMHGPAGDQFKARSTLLTLTKFAYSTSADKTKWGGLVSAFARQLPLFCAGSATAVIEQTSWLHKRSKGRIGTLQRIIGTSALQLIQRGDPARELMSRELMEGARLDYRTVEEGTQKSNDLFLQDGI